jgi:L-alanine-DL-glutamate epimerase-like enolase superfamily enzyme
MHRRDFMKHVVAGGAAAAALGVDSQRCVTATEAPLDVAAANRRLAEHRIAGIQSRRLNDRFPRSIGPNSKGRPVGRGGSSQARIITTDQGVTGWCMGGGHRIDPQPFIGTKVGDMFDISRGKADDVPWWLDKTLHDLAARILGVPVWKMIGAEGPREVRVYSGAIYMEDVVPEDRPRGIQAVVDVCRQDYEAGYRAFKLKIGRGRKWMSRDAGLQRDIAVTHAVHEALPDCRMLVDANDAYTVDEASRYVAAVADCNLYWIEEAFEENVDAYRRLREAMNKAGCQALIADGEARRDRAGDNPTRFGGYTNAFADRLFKLAEEKLIDIIVMDLDIVGFSRWRRAMPELVKAGVTASPHAWMWCLRTHQTAQLAGGVGNIPIVEGIPGRTSGVDYSHYRMQGGKLVLPDAPGFGLELTESR